jgi:hypothetical protein
MSLYALGTSLTSNGWPSTKYPDILVGVIIGTTRKFYKETSSNPAGSHFSRRSINCLNSSGQSKEKPFFCILMLLSLLHEAHLRFFLRAKCFIFQLILVQPRSSTCMIQRFPQDLCRAYSCNVSLEHILPIRLVLYQYCLQLSLSLFPAFIVVNLENDRSSSGASMK